MKNISKRPHRSHPGLIPEELIGLKKVCPFCNCETEIPWLEKLQFPKFPIKSNDGNCYWAPVSFPLTCSSLVCNKVFEVKIPVLPNHNRWSLYGDEAGRYITQPAIKYSSRPLNFYCITLVGLHASKHDRVRKQVMNLKRLIRPNDDPESWAHHFTRIWDSKPESNQFNLSSKKEKIEYAKRFAKVVREARPHLVSFNFSSCFVDPEEKGLRQSLLKHQKETLFSESILGTLVELRRQDKSVRWIFDNIQDTSLGDKIEGWASERFLGLQYTRLFCWLSSGSAVLEPSFVRPGSHFLLEVADFISYCVARDFFMAIMEKPSEFPSSLLGKGFYQGTFGDGHVESTSSLGLPIKKFYGVQPTR